MKNKAFSTGADRVDVKAANVAAKAAVERLYPHAKVVPTSQVMHCEDGAFVEVMVWLPIAEFQREPGKHKNSCPAYGNYQPPYEECNCGAEA